MATQTLLTETAACEALSLSRTTLRRLWHDGKLVPLKIGRSIRYTQTDIDSFVEQLVVEQRGEARNDDNS